MYLWFTYIKPNNYQTGRVGVAAFANRYKNISVNDAIDLAIIASSQGYQEASKAFLELAYIKNKTDARSNMNMVATNFAKTGACPSILMEHIKAAQEWLNLNVTQERIYGRINSSGHSGGAYKDTSNLMDVEYGIRVVFDPETGSLKYGGSFSFALKDYDTIREDVPHSYINQFKNSKLFMCHSLEFRTIEDAGRWLAKWIKKYPLN